MSSCRSLSGGSGLSSANFTASATSSSVSRSICSRSCGVKAPLLPQPLLEEDDGAPLLPLLHLTLVPVQDRIGHGVTPEAIRHRLQEVRTATTPGIGHRRHRDCAP